MADRARDRRPRAAASARSSSDPGCPRSGYEALYWVPFLRWVKAAFRLDARRVVVAVSRGGVAFVVRGHRRALCRDLGRDRSGGVCAAHAERGATKQLEVSRVRSRARRGGRAAPRRAGRRAAPVADVPAVRALLVGSPRRSSFLDATRASSRWRRRASSIRASLPRDYVAVKFYAARSLPDTPEIRQTLAMVRREPRGADQRRAARHRPRAGRARRLRVRRLETGRQREAVDDAGRQPRRADADHRRCAGVHRHVRQRGLAGADARRGHVGAVRRSEVAARAPGRGAARVSPRGRRTLRPASIFARSRCWRPAKG